MFLHHLDPRGELPPQHRHKEAENARITDADADLDDHRIGVGGSDRVGSAGKQELFPGAVLHVGGGHGADRNPRRCFA